MQVGIVGAGINGLYLAWKLSETGHKVVVFERKPEIGNSVCSGLFSERILDFVPQSKQLIKNKINYTLIHFPKKTIRVNFKKKFFVMDHAKLDKLVAGLAENSGAKIFLNKNIKDIPKGFDKIIGADGPNSVVRKTLNLPNLEYRLGILGFSDEIGSRRSFVETWPVANKVHFGQGFIWKIPRGDCVEYGILAPQTKAKELLFGFLNKNNIILEDIKAKTVPQSFSLPNNSSVALAGDAAGLTKPWSGGGVIWQLALDNILLENFPDFKKYKKQAKKFFIPKIILSKTVLKTVCFCGFKIPIVLPKTTGMESDFLL